MPLKLERKRMEVQNETNLLEERFKKFGIFFEPDRAQINLISKTKEGYNFLLAQFRVMNEALNKIPLKKD